MRTTATATSAAQEKLWTARDTVMAIKFAATAPAALLVPQRHWPGMARALSRSGLVGRGVVERVRPLVKQFVGGRLSDAEIDRSVRDLQRTMLLLDLHTLRALVPGAWRPPTRVEGIEHVRRAQQSGRGVVFWLVRTIHGRLATKLAFTRAGLQVHYLSRFNHPYTDSRLGVRLLNPIACVSESRLSASRIVIGRGQPPISAMRKLDRHLRDRELVAITIGADADDPMPAPCLDGWLRVGIGALRLAERNDAALLPVVTVAEGDGFAVTIHEAITGIEGLASVVAETALRHPGQLNWLDRVFAASPTPPAGGAGR